MAKKSRRAQHRAANVAQPVRISAPSKRLAETAAQEVDFSKEYHYVIEDLKRIAITAAGLLILLVVLALIVG
jgi:hypothetical protein